VVCTKTLRRWLVLLALLITGCGGGVKDDTAVEDQADADVAATGDEAAPGEPFVLIPNPYLVDPPKIPGRAKQEFAQALEAMNAKQWKQAEGMLRLMTESYPDLSGPFVNLGICQYRLEDPEAAEASFLQAIAVNANNMDAYTWLGTLYREQGRFEDAEQVYLKALEVWPHHAASHRNLGILYDLYMGRFDEALQHYKMLQKILPEEDRQVKGWIIDLERRLGE